MNETATVDETATVEERLDQLEDFLESLRMRLERLEEKDVTGPAA